jgi:dolichol-phosphate mannosyltransferase
VRLLVSILTYNEIENINGIIREVFSSVSGDVQCDILIVDDNSPDKTADAVKALQDEYSGRLFLLLRKGKEGFASAYIDGLSWGLERNYDYFLEMDADFSHDPKYIMPMLEKIKSCDFVIGSRNAGGRVEGWPLWRHILSKGGSLYSRIILGSPIKDLTGGFNMWRKETVEGIGLNAIISEGFTFQIEIKHKAHKKGYKYIEIPIVFRDRALGKSKMSKRIFFEGLINVWKIKSQTRQEM